VFATKYIIQAITAHPTAAAIILFNLRSALFCFRLCFSMTSASSGLKSDCILGAVFAASLLGLNAEYVSGIVTIPASVATKKGKNCP